jgi:hypothetical protein
VFLPRSRPGFILEGKIDTPGLYAPMSREIYGPVLEELRNEGIVLEETIINI